MGIKSAGFIAEEERPVGHEGQHSMPVAQRGFDDLLVGMTQDALPPQKGPDLALHHVGDQRAHDRGYRVEPRSCVPETLVAQQVGGASTKA
jgi:hypothetical protein